MEKANSSPRRQRASASGCIDGEVVRQRIDIGGVPVRRVPCSSERLSVLFKGSEDPPSRISPQRASRLGDPAPSPRPKRSNSEPSSTSTKRPVMTAVSAAKRGGADTTRLKASVSCKAVTSVLPEAACDPGPVGIVCLDPSNRDDRDIRRRRLECRGADRERATGYSAAQDNKCDIQKKPVIKAPDHPDFPIRVSHRWRNLPA